MAMTSLPPPPPPLPSAVLSPSLSRSKNASKPKSSSASEKKLISLLSAPEFSTAAYLNQALSTLAETDSSGEQDEDEQEQRIMTELALQLQVQTQSCHDEIGRIGAELRAILPRCATDLGRLNVGIENMKDDAENLLEAHLKSSLSNVANDAQKEEQVAEEDDDKENQNMQENDPSDHAGGESSDRAHKGTSMTMSPLETLETLSTLHALQQNLSLTKEILTAASTYNNTLQKIPSLLTPTTLNQGVQALIALENGARALSGMPGKSQRNEEIVQIRNQILTLLKPVLLHALNKMESRLGPLQTCVGMYQSLNKMESLMEEYVKSRPASIHKLWFDFRKSSVKKEVNEGEENVDGDDDLEFYNEDEGIPSGSESASDKHPNISSGKQNDIDPGKAFGDWLPTWYEAVLMLLGEERRRAHAVFGADLAPEVIVKVLNECFRPIISSFEARLTAICPSEHMGSVRSIGSSSFDAICNAYVSTMRFLSMCYEQMVDFDTTLTMTHSEDSDAAAKLNDGDGDQSNGIPSRTKTPVQLHMMARSVFIFIASPFAPYQGNYAKLEESHCDMAARMISSDIHSAVSERVMTLVDLQGSVERLSGLAPFMFPLAKDVIGRFESLTSGFRAQQALDCVDLLLSRHISEMSISFDTLSTNVLNEKNDLTENFDEQQVQCALEVLMVAGVVQRDLTSFDEIIRDRMCILAERIGTTIDQESALTGAVVNNSASATLVPDSLTIVEVEAILANSRCAENDDSGGANKSPSVMNLQRLSNSDPDMGMVTTLLPKSFDSTERLVKSCQSFVFDFCSALPFRHLGEMFALSIWGQEESMWSTTMTDSYGTLPQSYITQVGEHMLALVQALEPFSSDKNALQLANMAMDGVDYVADKSWSSFADAINIHSSDDKELLSMLKKGDIMKDYVINYVDNNFEDEYEEGDTDDSAAQAFCNQWLDAVCSAVTGLLLEQTVRIQRLSRKGCEHLSTDYNYIVNVLSALGVSGHPHPLLCHVAELTKMSPEDLQARISEPNDDGFGIRNTEARIALMRGISM